MHVKVEHQSTVGKSVTLLLIPSKEVRSDEWVAAIAPCSNEKHLYNHYV